MIRSWQGCYFVSGSLRSFFSFLLNYA